MSHTIGKKNIITLTSSLMLTLSTLFHKTQLNLDNPSTYTSSPIIPIEMILMFTTIILLLASMFSVILISIKRDWGKLHSTVAFLIISTILFVLAMIIDSPTLIYMT